MISCIFMKQIFMVVYSWCMSHELFIYEKKTIKKRLSSIHFTFFYEYKCAFLNLKKNKRQPLFSQYDFSSTRSDFFFFSPNHKGNVFILWRPGLNPDLNPNVWFAPMRVRFTLLDQSLKGLTQRSLCLQIICHRGASTPFSPIKFNLRIEKTHTLTCPDLVGIHETLRKEVKLIC